MIGKSYIDGLDLFATYGIYVTENGYNELVTFPALKAVAFNDWPEEDGREIDLLNPVLDTKTASISFAAKRGNTVGAFFTKLSTGAYHSFEFKEIKSTYYLRLLAQSNLKIADGEPFSFNLVFADDFPLSFYEYAAPSSAILSQGYNIDEIDLCNYGVTLLEGSNAEIAKSPNVKLNQHRNFITRPGLLDDSGDSVSTYDDVTVRYQTKEVTLKCVLIATSMVEFWSNYNALLFDFTRPGVRTLYCTEAIADFYYKRSQVIQFFPDGKIWCIFSLTLEFTNFRI